MNSMFKMELNNSNDRIGKLATFNEALLNDPTYKKYVPKWYDPTEIMYENVRKMRETYNGDAEAVDPLFNYIDKIRFTVGNDPRSFSAIPSNKTGDRFHTTKRKLTNSNYRILGLNSCKEKDNDPELWNKHLSNFKESNLRYFDLKEYIDFYHIGIAYNPESKVFYLLINNKIDSEKYPSEITKLIENNYSEVMKTS